MRFIISDESVNRYGYRILSRGMSTASFEKNPVVFYNHGTYNLPIGKGKNLQHEPDGSITLDIDFDMEDEQLAAMHVFAKQVAIAIKQVVPCKKVGVAVIGLEVPHAHIHLVPMNQVADLNFAGPRAQLTKEDFETTAAAISQLFI